MAHLKRYTAPKAWNVKRKGITFISRPSPGPHPLKECITLNLIVKKLHYAQTTREVKKILNEKKILINGIARKDHKFPLGVMDTISIPDTKQNFRLLINEKGKFILTEIKDKELLSCKIKNKSILKKKKIQLNLTNGYNLIVPKDTYKVGDTLLITDKKEIKKHLKLEKGSNIYLIGGRHIGTIGVVENIISKKDLQPAKILFKTDKHKYETLKEYAFVIEPNQIKLENDKSNAKN